MPCSGFSGGHAEEHSPAPGLLSRDFFLRSHVERGFPAQWGLCKWVGKS